MVSWLRARLRALVPWLVYFAAAYACTRYLNDKADLVIRRGEWYAPVQEPPYITLQDRAFLSGHFALVPHPSGGGNDYNWGRGGMHQAWGLGVPIVALPFHVVARMLGAPGFPDGLRFLVLYAATAVVLAYALHRAARDEPGGLVTGTAAAGFVMVFPTFVGLVTSRFLIYEQTIAVAALWDVLLLAGLVAVVTRCTPVRLALVCAAAGFSLAIRPPTAVFGLTTVLLALLVAWRRRLGWRALVAAAFAYGAGLSAFFVGNDLRFGSPFDAGYATSVSGAFVNRLTRWGLPFAKVPFLVAAKEMFATLFLLEPVRTQIAIGGPRPPIRPFMNVELWDEYYAPPPSVRPYAVGERWREYYAPTFNRLILAIWLAAIAVVVFRFVRGRLWRNDRTLDDDLGALVGAWAIPPVVVLFVFYARIGQTVTRYATDFYPAFAAASLCVGMAIVGEVRKRAPRLAPSAQLAIACSVGLYIAGWQGWATHLSRPADRNALIASIAQIDARARLTPVAPDHFECGEPRGAAPVHGHLEDWRSDCSFSSGMVFAMKHSPCVSFTFRPDGGTWTPEDDQSLASFRANADSDRLSTCGNVADDGTEKRVTMCDPRPPRYLLDGMRLYAIATLNDDLIPIDRLRLMRIDPAPSCP